MFGSGFGFANKGSGSVFVSGLIQPTRVDPLGLVYLDYLNTCKPKFWYFFISNTFKLFSLICEKDSCILWFLNELNLTYQRLIGFMASFEFILIVLVLWDRFLLCHTPIIPLSAFLDQILILIVDYVTT